MSIFKKEKQQTAKTVSEAIRMCLRIVESNDNIKFEKWGHMGEEERAVIKQAGKEIVTIRRRMQYREPTYYSVKGFGISEYVRYGDAEYDRVKSLFNLCDSKRHLGYTPKIKQSFFARLMERIRS